MEPKFRIGDTVSYTFVEGISSTRTITGEILSMGECGSGLWECEVRFGDGKTRYKYEDSLKLVSANIPKPRGLWRRGA